MWKISILCGEDGAIICPFLIKLFNVNYAWIMPIHFLREREGIERAREREREEEIALYARIVDLVF